MFKSVFKLDYWKKLALISYRAILGFSEDKCMKMSASLAYYAVFSIGPLLLIIIWFISTFYSNIAHDASAQQKVYFEITKIFGSQVTPVIHEAITELEVSSNSHIGVIIGIGTLIFTSTTVFVEIQDSINSIWGVKPKPKKGWLKFILNRLISFSMVLGLGFLLIASLLINSIILILTNYINEIVPGITINMLDWINTILTFCVITVLFGFIFKVLPDAKVRNRDIIGGAIFTAILFMIGRYGISTYLQYSAMASAYGAAGSIIVLLLWVYYSAAILYYGAEFTKEHSKMFDKGISPSTFAVLVKRTEVALKTGDNTDVKKGEVL